MTPPAAPPRHARPVAPTPPAAVAGAVAAFLGALVSLWLSLVLVALGEPDSGGIGRAWAVVPLVAAAALTAGGVALLRRRGWWPLAVGLAAAAVFVARLYADAAAMGEPAPWGLGTLVLAGPVLALLLALTPRVRDWLGSTG